MVGEALTVGVSVGSKVGESTGTCVLVATGGDTSSDVADTNIWVSAGVAAAGSSAGLHAANAIGTTTILNNNILVCFIFFLFKGSTKPHITLWCKIILSLLNSQCVFKNFLPAQNAPTTYCFPQIIFFHAT